MTVNPAVRYFVGALIVALVGWLVDLYLPLPPVAHVIAIICYIVAAVMVLLGVFALLRGGPVA